MASRSFPSFVQKLVLLAGAAAFAPAIAQTSLTLSEALARGQSQAPGLLGAQDGLRAAEAGAEMAGLRPNPTLTVEAENVLGSGRYAGFGGGDKTYTLSLPLELGGKREARMRVAEAERESAQVGVAATRAELVLSITRAFIGLAANQRRAEAALAGRDLAIQAAKAARERVESGKASPIEQRRGEVLQINAQVKADRAQRAVAAASVTLARLTGAEPPMIISAAWFDETGRAHGTEETSRPARLAAADAQVAAAQARLTAARSARVPDITVNAGMRRFGDSRDKAAVLAVSVPLPLLNTGTADVTRARAELDKAESERAAAVLDNAQVLADTRTEVADALAVAEAASGPALAAAAEAARIARIGYAEGKFSQLDLIDAERSLAETRETAVDALATLHDARARLARLQGSTAPLYKE